MLALLVQVAFIIIWVTQMRVDKPRGRPRSGGVVELRLWSMAGTPPRTIHPNARRTKPAPAPAKEIPRESETIHTEQPVLPPVIPKPEEPKNPPPEEAPTMSEREIEEFNRQWAQLQGDIKQKALDDAEHHELKMDMSETDRPFQKFSATPSASIDQDKKNETPRRGPTAEESMFAGELCVSRAGRDGEFSLAMPCVGDNFVTDYGWQSRVHAPNRGEPSPGTLDSTNRVIVSNYRFSAETLAAFQDAQRELFRSR